MTEKEFTILTHALFLDLKHRNKEYHIGLSFEPTINKIKINIQGSEFEIVPIKTKN